MPWAGCTAVEAHRRYHGLQPSEIALSIEDTGDGFTLESTVKPFQRIPFVAAELADGRFTRLYPKECGPTTWRLSVDRPRIRRLAAAVTDVSGATATAFVE